MSDQPAPRKRAAYEPVSRLAQPAAIVPDMKRPISTVAGALLVLLRVVSGTLVLGALLLDRDEWAKELEAIADGVDITDDVAAFSIAVFAAATAIGLILQLIFGILILRGQNLARVLVMFFSVISISSAFTGWWVGGQDIRIGGTLISIGLDILILLALSSRSSAAYARRHERG